MFCTTLVIDHLGLQSWVVLTSEWSQDYRVAISQLGLISVAISDLDSYESEEGWIRYAAKSDFPASPSYSIYCGSKSLWGGLLFRVCINEVGGVRKIELSSSDTKNGWFGDEFGSLSISNHYNIRFRNIPVEVAIGVKLICMKHFINHV
jgi:hypothetical protein